MPHYAPNLLTVIPARNEAATVAEIVRRVRAAVGGDVLVVNDASDDETSARARQAGAVVLDLPLRLGAWGAAQAGLRYARRNHYAVALTLDADGQHHPEELPRLVAAWLASGANVAIGTFPQRLSRAKRLAWRYLGEPPLMPRHASTTLAPPALHAWRTAPPRSSEPPSGPTASATARVRHAIDSLINVSTPIHPAGAPIVLLVVPSIFVDQAVGSDRLRLVPVLTAPRRT